MTRVNSACAAFGSHGGGQEDRSRHGPPTLGSEPQGVQGGCMHVSTLHHGDRVSALLSPHPLSALCGSTVQFRKTTSQSESLIKS